MSDECPPSEWWLEWRHRIPSTNDELRSKAKRGAPSGSGVAAVAQEDGHGRGTNAWVSPPGGVYVSALIREVPAALARLMPVAASVAVAQTIDGLRVPATTWLKWPNDVLAAPTDDDRPFGKVAGILSESASKGHRIDYVIVGVGVNLRTDPADLPSDLDPPALSLAALADRLPTVERFVDRYLDQLGDVIGNYVEDPDSLVADHLHDYAWLGEEVVLQLSEDRHDAEVTGTFEDIAPSGAIVLDVAGDRVLVEPWNAVGFRPAH